MLVAKELSYYPTETLETGRKPVKERNIKTVQERKIQTVQKQNVNRRSNSLAKLVVLFIPIIVLGIALSILFRYANMTAIRQEITQMEKQKMELERTKLDLIADLESIKSTVKIAEEATIKLGMNYPTEDQVVYVTVKENTTAVVEKASIGNQIKKILSMVTDLF